VGHSEVRRRTNARAGTAWVGCLNPGRGYAHAYGAEFTDDGDYVALDGTRSLLARMSRRAASANEGAIAVSPAGWNGDMLARTGR
jgi:hypothetical protein